jgi:hypothetical protein
LRQSEFEALCRAAKQTKWLVFAKPPLGGPERVLKYLAQYMHRVAISNRRLLSMENGRVKFEYKDYADGNQTKVMTLEATEFIRRFLLHILPSGFVRIRRMGFWRTASNGRNSHHVGSCSVCPNRHQRGSQRPLRPFHAHDRRHERAVARGRLAKVQEWLPASAAEIRAISGERSPKEVNSIIRRTTPWTTL